MRHEGVPEQRAEAGARRLAARLTIRGRRGNALQAVEKDAGERHAGTKATRDRRGQLYIRFKQPALEFKARPGPAGDGYPRMQPCACACRVRARGRACCAPACARACVRVAMVRRMPRQPRRVSRQRCRVLSRAPSLLMRVATRCHQPAGFRHTRSRSCSAWRCAVARPRWVRLRRARPRAPPRRFLRRSRCSQRHAANLALRGAVAEASAHRMARSPPSFDFPLPPCYRPVPSPSHCP